MASPYGDNMDGQLWPWVLDGEDDWFALKDANGRYVSDACVEGTRDEWREAADALRNGRNYRVKRLALMFTALDCVTFCSPRNTRGDLGVLPVAKAAALADIIDEALAKDIQP